MNDGKSFMVAVVLNKDGKVTYSNDGVTEKMIEYDGKRITRFKKLVNGALVKDHRMKYNDKGILTSITSSKFFSK